MTDHTARRILRIAGLHVTQTKRVLARADLSGGMYETVKHLSGSLYMEAARAVVDERLLRKGGSFWNGWSSNYMPSHDGYYIHAFTCPHHHSMDRRSGRAICGAPIIEGGGLEIPKETTPGCISCRRLLRAWGVMEEDE